MHGNMNVKLTMLCLNAARWMPLGLGCLSSGMWCCVAGWVVLGISKERSVFIIMVSQSIKNRPWNREDESDTFLRNIENHLPDEAASHPNDLNRRLQQRQNLKLYLLAGSRTWKPSQEFYALEYLLRTYQIFVIALTERNFLYSW